MIPARDDEPATVELHYKIKLHYAMAAAKQRCKVFGLENLPAPNLTGHSFKRAVELFMEKAAKRGIVTALEEARERLKPYFNASDFN